MDNFNIKENINYGIYIWSLNLPSITKCNLKMFQYIIDIIKSVLCTLY